MIEILGFPDVDLSLLKLNGVQSLITHVEMKNITRQMEVVVELDIFCAHIFRDSQ